MGLTFTDRPRFIHRILALGLIFKFFMGVNFAVHTCTCTKSAKKATVYLLEKYPLYSTCILNVLPCTCTVQCIILY